MLVEASHIGIVGATGVVGQEALAILAGRGFPISGVHAFARRRTTVAYGQNRVTTESITLENLVRCDALLFCATAAVALQFAPAAADQGVLCVDNSAAFRGEASIPLVIPEINADQITATVRLVANPNCSTILLLLALNPVRAVGTVRQVTVSTYQAVSGAGRAALQELRQQSAAVLEHREPHPDVFPHPCAFNVFPHESEVSSEDGSNGEERKIVQESRRILGMADLPIFPTCARVPVERAHSQSIVVEFEQAPDPAALRAALDSAPGVQLHAGPGPTPLEASHGNEVLVGRVRVDAPSRRVGLWACADQLRKGAALNAVQTLELMMARQKRAHEMPPPRKPVCVTPPP